MSEQEKQQPELSPEKFERFSEEVNANLEKYLDALKEQYDRNLVYMAVVNVQMIDFNGQLNSNPQRAIHDYPALMNDVMNTMSLIIGLKAEGDEERISQFTELRSNIYNKKNELIQEALLKYGVVNG